GRVDHGVSRPDDFVYQSNQFTLTHWRFVTNRTNPVYLLLPLFAKSRNPLAVCEVDFASGDSALQFINGCQGIARECESGVLVRIDLRHINIDEPNRRILKRRFLSAREITVTSSDPDNQIRLARD